MNYNERLLFYLLRIGLETETKYDFEFSEKPNWKFIFNMSSEQGVLAIVFDGLDYLANNNLITEDMLPPRDMRMQWAMNVMRIENVYNSQYRLASEIANEFNKNKINAFVLKGVACASLYPKPYHRPCGDLDCFMMGDYEKGNSIMESLGAINEPSYYKHSHYIYKNFLIENHKFCTAIRGPKKYKNFEKQLQLLLTQNGGININDSFLLSPDPLFNAIFLTFHSWGHFLKENIGLRHLCDWAMLLKAHCYDIDWERFINIISIRDRKMLGFARCSSYVAHYYMGVPMPPISKNLECPDSLSERFLKCVLYEPKKNPLKSKGFFVRKILELNNLLKGDWKFIEFSQDNRFKVIYKLFYDYFCEKNPHL